MRFRSDEIFVFSLFSEIIKNLLSSRRLIISLFCWSVLRRSLIWMRNRSLLLWLKRLLINLKLFRSINAIIILWLRCRARENSVVRFLKIVRRFGSSVNESVYDCVISVVLVSRSCLISVFFWIYCVISSANNCKICFARLFYWRFLLLAA